MSRKRIPLNQNGCTANFRIGVPFEQNLQEGYISVRSTNLPRLQELFLNRTTQNILKKCNGSNTVEQIIRIISDMYPDIQRQVIANDVVKNLSVLSRFQLIEQI